MDPAWDPVEVHRRVGYMPGELHIDHSMSVESLLRFFNELRGNITKFAAIQELADRLGLALKQPIRNLSHGNKQKVGIVQTLMHKPELIIMDEPTQGLDPLIQQQVLALIKEAQIAGATVFFSSHIMSEVEAIANQVGIIRAGRIVEVADPHSLGQRSLHRVHVRFKQAVDEGLLLAIGGVSKLSQANGNELTLRVEGDMEPFIKALATYPVLDMETERPSLEEHFLAFYKNGTSAE